MDKDWFLLCTPGGTYDLRNGLDGLREHSPNDFITKMTAYAPSDKGAEIWQDALNTFFRGDKALIEYVQRVAGMPTGEDADGNILYLPELYIDSPNLGAYTHPKWIHLPVSDAKEVTDGDEKKSKSQCYADMRKAAQAEFDAGCDLPKIMMGLLVSLRAICQLALPQIVERWNN